MRRKGNKIICVVDPMFIVSWSKFRYGDKLSQVIEHGYITEDFFELFSNRKTLAFLRSLLESKTFIVYNEFDGYEFDEVLSSIAKVSADEKRVCQFNNLLAKLLAISIVEGVPFLTDNYCVHRFARIYLDDSIVWSSYRVLRRMFDLGLFEDFDGTVKRFSEDTGIMFMKLDRGSL